MVDLLIQHGDHSLSFKDDEICQQRELFVQVFQHARIFLIIANAFEQGRTLHNDLAVLHKGLAIAWLHLAEGTVEKTSSLIGWTINKVQICRSEQDHLHLPNQPHSL